MLDVSVVTTRPGRPSAAYIPGGTWPAALFASGTGVSAGAGIATVSARAWACAGSGVVGDVDERDWDTLADDDVDSVDVAAFASGSSLTSGAAVAAAAAGAGRLLIVAIASMASLATGTAFAAFAAGLAVARLDKNGYRACYRLVDDDSETGWGVPTPGAADTGVSGESG